MKRRHREGQRHRQGSRPRLLATLTGLLLASDAVAQVQVTALEGAAQTPSGPLAIHASVADGELVEVEPKGRCTILVSNGILARVCGAARAVFHASGSAGTDRIELRDGELAIVGMAGRNGLQIETPAAIVAPAGPGVHVRVEHGETVVAALGSPARLSVPDGGGVGLAAGEEARVTPGGPASEPRALSESERSRIRACLDDDAAARSALRAQRAVLAVPVAAVSATGGGGGTTAAGSGTGAMTDLQEIVLSDFPEGGLPLQAPGAPSALVTELSKRGADEEVCDPITCNPVYQLDPPGRCGVPPQRGCIP